MLKWLKKRLRSWLEVEEERTEKLDRWLDCVITAHDGTTSRSTVYVTGRQGMHLIGKPLGVRGESIILIGASQAIDTQKFWKLWKLYTSDCKVSWE